MAGSAIGTVITQTGMALVLIGVVVRAARRVGAPLRPHAGHIRGAGRAGVPLFIRTLTLRLAIIVTTVVATRQGVVGRWPPSRWCSRSGTSWPSVSTRWRSPRRR